MKTQCPHCQTKFKAADEQEGKTVKCRKCGEAFEIVSVAEAVEPAYRGSVEDAGKGGCWEGALLGVFMGGGIVAAGMVIDEPFSAMGLRFIGFGLLIGGLIFAGLYRLISGSWDAAGKLGKWNVCTAVAGVVLGNLVLVLLRWEEAKDEWFVSWFATNTVIKVVLLLVNIPAYILVARRVSPSFRRVLAQDVKDMPSHWYEVVHTVLFVGVYLAQYLLIKIIFLD